LSIIINTKITPKSTTASAHKKGPPEQRLRATVRLTETDKRREGPHGFGKASIFYSHEFDAMTTHLRKLHLLNGEENLIGVIL
jgi:hypothetical protein